MKEPRDSASNVNLAHTLCTLLVHLMMTRLLQSVSLVRTLLSVRGGMKWCQKLVSGSDLRIMDFSPGGYRMSVELRSRSLRVLQGTAWKEDLVMKDELGLCAVCVKTVGSHPRLVVQSVKVMILFMPFGFTLL
mmetsp:Transcript_14339/g.22237  ORF Transcript_14339/g.22237 Transcript_14339/m.22237 type:complete len:133 (+) Transcript_14339:163-561(+)